MSDGVVTDIELIEAPYRRQVLLQDVAYESGMTLLRIRIREGTRFTILDIDAATARAWGERMLAWSDAQTSNGGDASAAVMRGDDGTERG